MSLTLSINDLHVQRGATLAVRGVDFRFNGPGWFGIIGANGSGKTSLLRAIAGRLEPTAGSIVADGIDRTGDRAWRARHIGFAPEGAMLPDALTVHELYGVMNPGWADAMLPAAMQLHRALGIDALSRRRIGSLSAGMRQRVAIFSAFAAASERRIVILDEPFNWLDPVASYDVKVALAALVTDGLTLLTALHDLNSLALLCAAGVMMADGRVVADLTETDLVSARQNLPRFERDMMDRLRTPSSSR